MLRRKRSNSPTARRKQNKLSSDKSDKACQHFWRLSQSNQSRPCRKSTSLAIFHQEHRHGMATPHDKHHYWKPLKQIDNTQNKKDNSPDQSCFFLRAQWIILFRFLWICEQFSYVSERWVPCPRHGLICTRKTRMICCFIFPDQKSHGLKYVYDNSS